MYIRLGSYLQNLVRKLLTELSVFASLEDSGIEPFYSSNNLKTPTIETHLPPKELSRGQYIKEGY